ncbi:MAG: prephenate dehydratase [Magnetococcales bacterium]|nr:prephenate dehydratase [Magnetococcales bacterium]MBF0148677.1 prephenate dehydratase [Magnetococcales bacterium]MBF0173344.1 prephenate dehydratase [Magnetococcales bacterium]MBF0347276.1 prephenate dehydratase [Magnetococcales bacterium]MBF0631483.1 prephenate dehydratase [Magnetococcales bacterium]
MKPRSPWNFPCFRAGVAFNKEPGDKHKRSRWFGTGCILQDGSLGVNGTRRIAFQGMPGAYSEQACRERFPGERYVPCKTFEDVFTMVEEGSAELGVVPVENSMAGGISDSYDLLAAHHLHIVGEYYLKVSHCLLGIKGARIENIHTVASHPQALAQCRAYIRKRGWNRNSVYDTAGAACDLAVRREPHEAAIASELCAELYGLDILMRDIQENKKNTTRFLVISRTEWVPRDDGAHKTSLFFEVRNIPAALYKCLGGFATNNVNLTRLESRPIPGKHWSYHFHLDFQGRPDDPHCRLALEELEFFTSNYKILGCYPESPDTMDP